MLRIALISSIVLASLLSFQMAAEIPAQSLRGHVWLDLTADGAYLRVDRHENTAPDGLVDDEYFLMMRTGLVVLNETLDLGEAFVTSTSHGVTVLSSDMRTRYVWTLEGAIAAPASERLPVSDRVPSRMDEKLEEIPANALEGYGIRYSGISLSRAEILADPSWQRGIAVNNQCDAGGGCFATQCSISCSEGISCSVTCSANTSACCRCISPTKPSCTCVTC
jgi:hypothetical protein